MRWAEDFATGCITRYKDTNLKAIHNLPCLDKHLYKVVLLDTKIQIWKQFTTPSERYDTGLRCITRYKDTNLKAIHNQEDDDSGYIAVVLLDTKIQIWKQFTTFDVELINTNGCITKYKDTNLNLFVIVFNCLRKSAI